MVQLRLLSFIQTQLSDSGKRLIDIVITTVVIIGRKVKDNSAFSTRTRCFKNIGILKNVSAQHGKLLSRPVHFWLPKSQCKKLDIRYGIFLVIFENTPKCTPQYYI